MQFLREKFWPLAILAAIVASFVVGNAESNSRDRAQHAQLVAGCIRNSTRASLVAAYQHETAEARRSSGTAKDAAIAAKYDAFSRTSTTLIPAPAGLTAGDPALAEVLPVRAGGKIVRFRLTDRAKALQAAGCARAYP